VLIKQLLHEAFADDDINLQALIMFLVFEKQVLSMEDDQSELNLYFLPKHEKRMGEELTKYKRKMKMIEKPSCYRIFTKQNETLYIYATSEIQASGYASSLNYKPIDISYYPDRLIYHENEYKYLSELTTGITAPSLLGQNNIELKYNYRNIK